MEKQLSIYISYSSKDRKYFEELLKHLTPLTASGRVRLLHDRGIEPGVDWSKALAEFASMADVFLFLVSPNSLASSFVNEEISTALNRLKEQPVRIIPVILEPVAWQQLPIASFQALPAGAKPVSEYSNRDQAYFEITEQIRRVIQSFRTSAEEIITFEKQMRSGQLNLSGQDLTSLPASLSGMNWLTELDLSNNALTDLAGIRSLQNLKKLTVTNNQISHWGEINQLTNLSFLDLSNNAISIGTDGITIHGLDITSKYPVLVSLRLSNNRIVDLPELGHFPALEELDLSGNAIITIRNSLKSESLKKLNLSTNMLSQISGLERLPALAELLIRDNVLEKISGLEQLTRLETLDLHRNLLSVIERLDENRELITLGLSNNKISVLENIGHLSKLQNLYIGHNNIEDITVLQNLSSLKRVVLTNNRITDLLPLKDFIRNDIPVKYDYSFDEREAGFFVKDNPIQYPPLEVLQQGKDAILRNFAQQEKALEEQLPPYQSAEIKLILIGNPNVGKTHIAHYIKTKRSDLPLTNASTHGMVNEIMDYNLPAVNGTSGAVVKMRILDFGGQEYYHDTHHLFFTNDTVYLLLWDKKTNKFGLQEEDRYNPASGKNEKETNTVFPVAYWLDAVNYFVSRREEERRSKINPDEADKPVKAPAPIDPLLILVETKRDKKGAELMNTLPLQSFKNLVHSQVAISLYRNESGQIISTGTDSLFDSLNNLAGSIFEKRWSGYYKLVVDFFENFTAPSNQDLLKAKKAADLIIDLQDCVQVFNALIKREKLKYKFDNANAQDLCRYLANRGYILYFDENRICLRPDDLTKQIYAVLSKEYNNQGIITPADAAKHDPAVISIMQDFKLLVPHPSGNGFIAPQLLPETVNSQLSMFMDAFKPPAIRFSITGYIHKNILQELFNAFREQLLKEDTQNYIWRNGFVIKMNNDLYRINISSTEECRLITLQYLNSPNYKTLNELSNSIQQLLAGRSFRKEVSTDGNLFVPAELIKNNVKLSQFVFNDRLLRVADYSNFLDAAERQFALKKLFISYSSKNTDFMRRLETHLAPLKRNGDIDFWHDRMIEPGTSWDESIRKEMEASDIIVFLLSPDFIATNYIFEVEIPKALELYGKRAKLFFIELQPCNWEKTILANYQQTVDPQADNKGVISIGQPQNDTQWKKAISELTKILQ